MVANCCVVNNWGDYGGMDVYTSKLGGAHKDFYTSTTIKNAYKNYVKTIVNRYKSSSAIFSWQLAKYVVPLPSLYHLTFVLTITPSKQ